MNIEWLLSIILFSYVLFVVVIYRIFFHELPRLAIAEFRFEVSRLKEALMDMARNGAFSGDGKPFHMMLNLLDGAASNARSLTFIQIKMSRMTEQQSAYSRSFARDFHGALDSLSAEDEKRLKDIVAHLHYWMILLVVKRSALLSVWAILLIAKAVVVHAARSAPSVVRACCAAFFKLFQRDPKSVEQCAPVPARKVQHRDFTWGELLTHAVRRLGTMILGKVTVLLELFAASEEHGKPCIA